MEAVYLDGVSPEEEQEFYWLSKHKAGTGASRDHSAKDARASKKS